MYLEFSNDRLVFVLCERNVLVDTEFFWNMCAFSSKCGCCSVCVIFSVHIFDCVCMFWIVWVIHFFFGVLESWDKLVFCPLLCSWGLKCFEMCILCVLCVFFCVHVLWWALCWSVCTLCLVQVFFWLCVLGSVCLFPGACNSVFFDVQLCVRVCMWECLCVVRCVSLNSLRDRKRTLRTRRSSHHGIPSLMSCRVTDTNQTLSASLTLPSEDHQTLHTEPRCILETKKREKM